jgi:hypothetical protein
VKYDANAALFTLAWLRLSEQDVDTARPAPKDDAPVAQVNYARPSERPALRDLSSKRGK